jgi:hypothetical protein
MVFFGLLLVSLDGATVYHPDGPEGHADGQILSASSLETRRVLTAQEVREQVMGQVMPQHPAGHEARRNLSPLISPPSHASVCRS